MLSSFINAAICSQPSFTSAVAFVLAHRLADVNEEDEMTTMFTMFQDSLASVRNRTLADLVAVRTRVSRRRRRPPGTAFGPSYIGSNARDGVTTNCQCCLLQGDQP
jgi:uncharacterized surface protein with fasciclin (FAS1) repeats